MLAQCRGLHRARQTTIRVSAASARLLRGQTAHDFARISQTVAESLIATGNESMTANSCG